MVNSKLKMKQHKVLSRGQNRLLKASLKQLLGQGLLPITPVRSAREEKINFLKDAIDSKILNSEWIA